MTQKGEPRKYFFRRVGDPREKQNLLRVPFPCPGNSDKGPHLSPCLTQHEVAASLAASLFTSRVCDRESVCTTHSCSSTHASLGAFLALAVLIDTTLSLFECICMEKRQRPGFWVTVAFIFVLTVERGGWRLLLLSAISLSVCDLPS